MWFCLSAVAFDLKPHQPFKRCHREILSWSFKWPYKGCVCICTTNPSDRLFLHIPLSAQVFDEATIVEGAPVQTSLRLKTRLPARPVCSGIFSANNKHLFCVSRVWIVLACWIWTMCTLIQSGCTEEEEGGGRVGAASGFNTHHDNASRLLDRAHAHNGRHADGGALEVNAAAEDRGQMLQEESARVYNFILCFISLINEMKKRTIL